MLRGRILLLVIFAMTILGEETLAQAPISLQLRFQTAVDGNHDAFKTEVRQEEWLPGKTAIIVCDMWDYHHCLNAVRREEQFAPRLNEVLMKARESGVTIIHSPSDCMQAYADHPARLRAEQATVSNHLPRQIESWCSIIPAEERAVYPVDQSDGGEDDDPVEHAQWAAKLEAMGRNPKMPWKEQTNLLTIDPQRDFITDQGDQVWNILEDRKIENVVLVGVHLNMCVLGRPFGLRQMARNGKNVVLMRDMTDTMYNPQRWPYVSHFEGTRRVISHVERFVCPTITSDQWIGGEPFRFEGDDGDSSSSAPATANPPNEWVTVSVPHEQPQAAQHRTPHWYRCVVRMPQRWLDHEIDLKCPGAEKGRAWINGHELPGKLQSSGVKLFPIPSEWVEADDANLIVIQLPDGSFDQAPVIRSGEEKLPLAGRWQMRIDAEQSNANMPLPAKFGASTDIVFTADKE